jgi:uncharacterized protein (TIGR02996 family)
MPRYEKGIGPAKMVWEIEVDDCFFHIRYGKARAKQLDTYKREHHTPELAREAAEDLIAQRVKDGYHPVSDEPLVRPPPPPSELEQQFRDNPDDDAVYLVLADWLQAQEHPRGRLMTIQHRYAQATDAIERVTLLGDEAALIAQHRDVLLGSLAKYEARLLDARWHRGYLDDIRLAVDRDNDMLDAERALGTLLGLPDAHFLRSLRLGIPYADEPMFDDIIDALVENARYLPRLVRLHVGDFECPDESEMSWTHLGSLAGLYPAFPKLEQLIVQGGDFKLGRLALPALRHLEVRTGGLSAENFGSIVDAELPALETLIVWIGDDRYGADVGVVDVVQLIGAMPPLLRHLGFCNTALADQVCELLVDSAIAKRLETLDLSLGTMSDDGAEQLAGGTFPNLRKLDVSDNYLTEVGLDRLRTLGVEVVTTRQKDAADEERYVSVGE